MTTPRSALVLGSGRSGTSMIAGTLAASGYHLGEGLHRPRAANPKGFFETAEINGINEELLAAHVPAHPRLAEGQRWLAVPRADARFVASAALERRIARACATQPFCIKDPRLSYTLPAWRPFLPAEVGHVCVFRHPALTVRSMLEECRTARYLRGIDVDAAHALRVWTAMYRTILERHRQQGAWLFLHYDQALSGEGLDALEAFLGCAVDRGFPDRALSRPPRADALPSDAAAARAAHAVYRELCELAGYAAPEVSERPAPRSASAKSSAAPEVTVIALVEDGADDDELRTLAADVRAQRGIRAELVLVDLETGIVDRHGTAPWNQPAERPALATRLAPLGDDALRIVRPERFGAGHGYRAALAVARGQRIAFAAPGVRPLATWLVRAVAALEGPDDATDAAGDAAGDAATDAAGDAAGDSAARPLLATCDLWLTDADGQFIDRSSPAAMGEAPGPFWHAGVVLERDALATIRTAAFRPVELELYQRLHSARRVVHVEEPGVCVARERFDRAWERSRDDASLLAYERRPFSGPPELSVSFCTYDRAGVLPESLAAFCRQLVPHGTYELVIVDDGSRDETAALLERIDFPVPVQRVQRANGGLAAARNTGLELARGRLVLFVNDDTIAAPELVAEHLRAHAALAAADDSHPWAVLGSFEQPPAALDNLLLRYLEHSTEVFAYSAMRPEVDYDGLRFYTCNVSVPLAAVRAAGDFDTDFRHYGCEDTELALRLEAQGLRVRFVPTARARHRHFMDFDYFARRQRMVAKAFVRLFRKHPHALARWGAQGLTKAACDAAVAEQAPYLAAFEDAARELARLDVGGLERLGGPGRETADEALEQAARLIRQLNRIWWSAGYAAGFEEHGLDGFPELFAQATRAVDPAPSPSRIPAAPVRLPAPELSVLVATHDRPDRLVQLIEALARQDLPPRSFEVIVCDDGSRRSAAELLARRKTPFALEVLRQNGGGPARARNLGLARARGDVIVFLNDDAIPAADCLRRHLAAQRGASRPRAVLGAFPLLPELVRDSFTALCERTDILFAQPIMKPGAIYHGLALCTGNVSLPRASLVAVGGFEARLPFAGGEDSELGRRLQRELGLGVQYEPCIIAQHDHALTIDGYLRRQRVLGWSVHAIAGFHGTPEFITADPALIEDGAPSAGYWAELAETTALERAEATALAASVADICRREREARSGPRAVRELEPVVRGIGAHEFRIGLLLAHAGVRARQLLDTDPAAILAQHSTSAG